MMCKKTYTKEEQRQNRARIIEKRRKLRAIHNMERQISDEELVAMIRKVFRNKQQKEYCEKNKVTIKSRKKTYYERNREKVKEYQKEYRERNKAIIADRRKEYYERRKLTGKLHVKIRRRLNDEDIKKINKALVGYKNHLALSLHVNKEIAEAEVV
jgi:hypothetical protein